MNKQFIASLCILAVVGVAVGVGVEGADEAGVGATVTPKLVSVSVSSGIVAYGILDLDATKNTALYHNSDNLNGMDVAQTQIVTSESNVDIELNIKSSNAEAVTDTNDWILNSVNTTENYYIHEFKGGDVGSWTQLPVDHSYAALDASPVADSVGFDLQITTPTSTNSSELRTITVTIQATE